MTSAHWAQVHSVTAISYLQAAAAHIRHTHGMTSFRTHHMGHHQTDTSAHNLFLNVSLCSRKERKEKKRKEKRNAGVFVFIFMQEVKKRFLCGFSLFYQE